MDSTEKNSKETDKDESFSKIQSSKKSRANKKQLYINLKNQMEFYFSPANLNKDRFLSKLIQAENECKCINVFIKYQLIN